MECIVSSDDEEVFQSEMNLDDDTSIVESLHQYDAAYKGSIESTATDENNMISISPTHFNAIVALKQERDELQMRVKECMRRIQGLKKELSDANAVTYEECKHLETQIQRYTDDVTILIYITYSCRSWCFLILN